jgi:hypothetical protein
MKVKYIGNPTKKEGTGEPVDTSEFIKMYGISFKLGDTVDISRAPPNIQAKFSGNSHFRVVDGKPDPREDRRDRRQDKDSE